MSYDDPNILDVRVLHSEYNTHYHFRADHSRLREFYKQAMADPSPGSIPDLPGVSGPALTGLQAIFLSIPSKFPLADLLRYLQAEQTIYGPTGCSLSLSSIEGALERFGKTVDSVYPLGS